jgi:hypothetical protein
MPTLRRRTAHPEFRVLALVELLDGEHPIPSRRLARVIGGEV